MSLKMLRLDSTKQSLGQSVALSGRIFNLSKLVQGYCSFYRLLDSVTMHVNENPHIERHYLKEMAILINQLMPSKYAISGQTF